MFKSVSKIVFLLMALAIIVALFLNKIDPKDFIALASMSFVYYFTKKNGTPAV